MDNIVLFDGLCNFCNSSVNFIIRNDTKKNFHFLSLQSKKAEILLKKQHIDISFETIYLVQKENVFDKSTAALLITKKLDFPYNFLYAFIIVPKFIRDAVYLFVSRNRYRLMGKKDVCIVPDEAFKARFLG
jgi:predicted DCC family thiol-disulfide oxidoreductase YuxK